MTRQPNMLAGKSVNSAAAPATDLVRVDSSNHPLCVMQILEKMGSHTS